MMKASGVQQRLPEEENSWGKILAKIFINFIISVIYFHFQNCHVDFILNSIRWLRWTYITKNGSIMRIMYACDQ